ncbi:MAG: heavy metal translocating P-type ATPase [Synergistaceae bacterium]|nr:heavy metal translocating P-type ATPase [Synergistaceae bacterium]
MEYTIAHELPGRIRLRLPKKSFTAGEAPVLAALFETQPGVKGAKASHRTGSVLILFQPEYRERLLAAASVITKEDYEGIELEQPSVPIARTIFTTAAAFTLRLMLPPHIRGAVCLWRALPFVRRGLAALAISKKLNISVLDAAAISSAIVRGDYLTASIVMTLMSLAETLESWTQCRSKEDLAESLALRVDKVWVRKNGVESEIPFSELRAGDMLVVRAGSVIPADGRVAAGEAVVNQASMTGEPLGIVRRAGASVYAGTAVEEGEITVEVTAAGGETRINKIIEVIEESESRKARVQGQAERLADSIVPFNFLLAALIYIATGSAERAASAIMVDYSCAIKIATPLAILAAMREGVKNNVLIKGGKFIEAMAEADTVVFDKTGTLTEAEPRVAEVIPLGGRSREEVLRLAACLEEHFPHPIARAVVRKAEEEKLRHEEEHAEVKYAIAHGIASSLRGEKAVIGSRHFVFEDEKTPLTEEAAEAEKREAERGSLLYLAVGGEAAGIICIEDPLRKEAPAVIAELKKEGFGRIIMLTGDGRKAAEKTAAAVGISETGAELLPRDKSEYLDRLKEKGLRAAMIGDGVNDSPALSAASVGVTMKNGADIAQEVANIVLLDNRLEGIVTARRISKGTMKKIRRSYVGIVGVNTLLILLGLSGSVTPRVSAVLHNLATLAACGYGLSPVLRQKPR